MPSLSCTRPRCHIGSAERKRTHIAMKGKEEDAVKVEHLRSRYQARGNKLLNTASLLYDAGMLVSVGPNHPPSRGSSVESMSRRFIGSMDRVMILFCGVLIYTRDI